MQNANQRTAAEEIEQDESEEDEEWTFLSKLKDMKQKVKNKLASKFKS